MSKKSLIAKSKENLFISTLKMHLKVTQFTLYDKVFQLEIIVLYLLVSKLRHKDFKLALVCNNQFDF